MTHVVPKSFIYSVLRYKHHTCKHHKKEENMKNNKAHMNKETHSINALYVFNFVLTILIQHGLQ